MKIAVVAPARSISQAGAARVAAFAALYYPQVELVIDPQVYLESGHFAGPDAVARRGVPAIRQRPGRRRDLVRARRLWLEPHPRRW